jgi:NAD(P)-dependent dehydrogenase (short-subunit alcohol dehydrogenase family)
MDVSGKAAIVTGSGRGIGRAIALALATNGADVVAADINLGDAQSVAGEVAEMGRRSVASHVDVTEQESVERMAEQVVERFGRIDILVNNAGTIGAPGWEERERPDESDWDLIYAVNVKGVARVTDVVAGYMKERRYGKIVNIASIAGRLGSTTNIPYSASKAGVINLTQASALELAPFNINVNAICPGILWTPLWNRIAHYLSTDTERWEGLSRREIFDQVIKERIPLGREQVPEDIGNLAAFLASDYARNITGQAINVSGGSHLN